eukprot:GILK01008140.1.p1 GENE.GILK01008140.1~~GILK01008140.1.p1  ORF type:complete len:164 (-),score=21.43 GILK01008140.1:97-588(-)
MSVNLKSSLLQLKDITGQPLSSAVIEGKPVLVVNTASQCGFTGQLQQLEEIHQKFKDSGLVVLGVPSNDFGAQEPGSEHEIQEFYCSRYKASFPLTSKVETKGDAAHPFFNEVRAVAGEDAGPKWNFFKYLVNKDGSLGGFWNSRVAPDAPEVLSAIETSLSQ